MLENHVGNVQLMQRLNRLKVLNVVRRRGRVLRADIAHLTGLSLSSVTNIVNYLMSIGLILDADRKDEHRVGRKAAILEFNPSSYALVCCAVTSNEVVTAVCSMDGGILDKSTVPMNVGDDIENVVCDRIKAISANADRPILACGVAVSAMVLDGGNTVLSSSLGYNIYGFADRLREKLDMPVMIENLSITNAVYHALKSFGDTHNLLFADFVSGIGAVQLFCGEVNRAFVGEIGHTTVDAHSDVKCVCGNYGCLECLCSPSYVIRRAGASDFEELKRNFLSGDKKAVEAVSECMQYLGIGIANLIDTVAPDRIILNGSDYFDCRRMYELFLENVKKRALSKLAQKTHFTITRTDSDQALCGMALHLCEAVFDISFEKSIIE